MRCAVCGVMADQVTCWACLRGAGTDEDTADLITADDLTWDEARDGATEEQREAA